MKILYIFLIFIFAGCSQNRNFEGGPDRFPINHPAESSSIEYFPELLHGFRANTDGFHFYIFQRSANGYYGRNIDIQVNTKTQRVSIENVSSGTFDCYEQNNTKNCTIRWIDSGHFFEFDTNKYQIKFIIKHIVAVKTINTVSGYDLEDCVLKDNEDFVRGEGLEIILNEINSTNTKKIAYYNFGTQNFGQIRNENINEINYFYSFDFLDDYPNVAYFFDSYPIRELHQLKLFRIGARALDEAQSNIHVHFCFYDNI